MKIQRTDHDDLNISLNILIEQSDYITKFNAELKKYREKAQLKGFRKGKTPLSFVKKMYGQSILADAVNESLQNSLQKYISDESLHVLGDPLPSDSQKALDLNANKLSDYNFDFDIGVSPDFELKGASEEDSYGLFNISIEDSIIDEEISMARKKLGKQVEITENIKEKDILTLEAKELDGKKIKENGWETGFTVMVDMIGIDDLKKSLLSSKKGDEIEFDIYKLEKNRDEAQVKKYFLNLDDNEEKEIGNMFRATISKVQRLEEAKLDQEFFDGYFGPDVVKTEVEANEKIKENISSYYKTQAKSFMYREILERLVELNDFQLPEEFLKRWLKVTNEKMDDEKIEKEFPDFIKNLKWTLIREKLAKREDIQVAQEEIQEDMASQVRQYFGSYGMDNAYIEQTIQKMMSDRGQVNKTYEELLSKKVFVALEKKIKMNEQNITVEDFKEKVKATNERLNN